MHINIERVYGSVRKSGEFRVLVDRLWPRGLSKQGFDVDMWAKEIAPSAELRSWFGHAPERFGEFRRLYLEEIAKNPVLPEFIKSIERHTSVALLYSAKDTENNQAVVLLEFLNSELGLS